MFYGFTHFDREACKAVYEAHNAAVREYFSGRPDDLLEDADGQVGGAEVLGGLLGVWQDVGTPREGVELGPEGLQDPRLARLGFTSENVWHKPAKNPTLDSHRFIEANRDHGTVGDWPGIYCGRAGSLNSWTKDAEEMRKMCDLTFSLATLVNR